MDQISIFTGQQHSQKLDMIQLFGIRFSQEKVCQEWLVCLLLGLVIDTCTSQIRNC